MMNYRIYDYYTLYDLINHYEGTSMKVNLYKIGAEQSGEFQRLISLAFDVNIEDLLNEPISQPIVNTLWCKYFVPGNLSKYVVRCWNNQEVEFNNWLSDFIFILNKTYVKYKKLIELYQQEESNLLNQVGNVSINTINETPQIPDEDFSGNEYASTISKIETKSDVSTIIARLAEIKSLYVDIYTEWAKEFKHFFITTAEYNDED